MMANVILWLWRVLTHRWSRYVVCWLVVLGLAANQQRMALRAFSNRPNTPDDKLRRDGNDGHANIDFAGQWLLGRMLVRGHGRELYNLNRLSEVAQQAYPWEREPVNPKIHDADELIRTFMDTDEPLMDRKRKTLQVIPTALMGANGFEAVVLTASANEQYLKADQFDDFHKKHVGGPLYPPIQALVFAPLALDDEPQWAYFTTMWIMLGMVFVGGLGVSVLTRGRIWWPVAAAIILVYPGLSGGHQLGQNPPLSLAILVWGWALVARGYESGGGLVWGLMAYKPVWAAAFLLVPILTRRWRMAGGMIAVGIAAILVTLPFVGIGVWLDWLRVGDLANRTYDVDSNWVFLSRDLLGISRRFLLNWHNPHELFERDRWYAHVVGWTLWAFVVEATVRLARWRRERCRETTGPAAAFVLLGAWLACFHFMYYDALLAALGFFALLDPPRQFLRPRLVTLHSPTGEPALDQSAIDYLQPRLAQTHPNLTGPGVGRTWVVNSGLIYFAIALLIVQHTLPWLNLGVWLTARHAPPRSVMHAGEPMYRDGKPVIHTPHLLIGSETNGPPWDTYLLLGLWAWCGVRLARSESSDDSAKEIASWN